MEKRVRYRLLDMWYLYYIYYICISYLSNKEESWCFSTIYIVYLYLILYIRSVYDGCIFPCNTHKL